MARHAGRSVSERVILRAKPRTRQKIRVCSRCCAAEFVAVPGILVSPSLWFYHPDASPLSRPALHWEHPNGKSSLIET